MGKQNPRDETTMNTQEMIKMAKEMSGEKNVYSKVYAKLVEEVSESEENYYTTPRWIEHEKVVLQAIKDESDKKVRKALEGLIL